MIFLVINFVAASAAPTEQMFITISQGMDKIIFDGKWSYKTEWKQTSLYSLNYDDGTLIQLRLGHQNNFVYVFVDDVHNTHFAKGSDRALLCIDTKNDKENLPSPNDYCFVATLDGKNNPVLQGGSPIGSASNYNKIVEPEGLVEIGSLSDANDPYSKTQHPGYEFRIPTELIGRSNTYGFYLDVYHSQSAKTYSWPQEINSSSFNIPSPKEWGEIISPDKSLPEFPVPALLLLPSLLVIVYFTKFKKLNQ